MIRYDRTYFSCTITDVDVDGVAQIGTAPFREALFETSTLVIYEFEGRYYYPLTMEYRLIDNNILYLIEELGLHSMEEVMRVLASSMEKEEKWSNAFACVVVHLKSPPRFMFALPDDFDVEPVTRHIYE